MRNIIHIFSSLYHGWGVPQDSPHRPENPVLRKIAQSASISRARDGHPLLRNARHSCPIPKTAEFVYLIVWFRCARVSGGSNYKQDKVQNWTVVGIGRPVEVCERIRTRWRTGKDGCDGCSELNCSDIACYSRYIEEWTGSKLSSCSVGTWNEAAV